MTLSIPVRPKNQLENPEIISLTSDQALDSQAAYIVRVTPDVAGHTLTVGSNQSALVQNEGSVTFNVSTTGNSDVQLAVGAEVRCTWSNAGSNHELQLNGEPGSITIDSTVSTSSTNAVENQAITSYVDSEIAGVSASLFPPLSAAATAHGFTSSDIGKPLARDMSGNWVIWDDTSSKDPWGIMRSITDSDNFKWNTRSARLTDVATTLLPTTSFSLYDEGPFLYWDASVGRYDINRPSDHARNVATIQVTKKGAQVFDLIYLG